MVNRKWFRSWGPALCSSGMEWSKGGFLQCLHPWTACATAHSPQGTILAAAHHQIVGKPWPHLLFGGLKGIAQELLCAPMPAEIPSQGKSPEAPYTDSTTKELQRELSS